METGRLTANAVESSENAVEDQAARREVQARAASDGGSGLSLRLLILTDQTGLADLLVDELSRTGFQLDWRRAADEGGLMAGIEWAPDIILASYKLEALDGLRALRIIGERGLDIPFVFVSGAEDAVAGADCIKSGASDYLRSDRLGRAALGAAVVRALEEGRLRGERRRAFEMNQRWAALVESCDAAVIGQTLRGFVTSWNPAAQRLLGYSPAEMIGRSAGILIPPEFEGEEARILARVSGGERIRHPELVRVAKDGRRVHLAATLSPIMDARGGVIGASMIAEQGSGRKGQEDQSRQAQKMEAIGHLAGGIAHDFSNILTVINAYAGILLAQPGIGEEAREHLNQLASVVERAGSLPRQLLTFSRDQMARLATLDLHKVLTGAAEMLQRVIGEQVCLRLECPADLPPVCADAGMIEQVLMNLSLNARDAMPRGGQLVIRASHVVTDESCLRSSPQARPGAFVAIEVSDTGCGMKPEVLARVFEPFFTTKEPGEGTGLGLATVFSIVQQHHGWVEVRSAVGAGTVFKVFLPSAPPGKATLEPMPPPPKARRGTETILLVEDEPQVRRLALKTLEQQGYRVIAAASGAAALSAWNQHGGEIDLLITDMVMPDGMNGAELIVNLRHLNPGLKAVLMSGYCMDSSDPGGALRADVTFLQKPYSPEKLSEAARMTLDA